jgi:hypothetical protein
MRVRPRIRLAATSVALFLGSITTVTLAQPAHADHNTPIPGNAVICQYQVTSGSTLNWYNNHSVTSSVAARTPAGTRVTAYRDYAVRPSGTSVTFRPRGSRFDPIWANAARLQRTNQPCFF